MLRPSHPIKLGSAARPGANTPYAFTQALAGVLLLILLSLCGLLFAAFGSPPAPHPVVIHSSVSSQQPTSALAVLSPEARQLHTKLRLNEVLVESLLWKPRVFLLHALLTHEECDQMIAMARPELEASTVVDVATGQGVLSQVRTSSGMFIMQTTPTIDTIRQRVSHIVHLPEENQEAIQILRYKPGQFYRPHQDFFADQTNIDRGGQRTATVLMYLTDVEGGGETIFPNGGGQSECGGAMSTGFAVKPRKGDAVLFYSMTPSGKEDSSSIHGSCEVTKGEKWSATIWIRTGKFV